ncbi:hypothetical protein KIW84_055765 [Lathyrus oleraceus]|uniref:Uncharacterized protein n=1 Tax=Pisum sativum TaxID=3888 RepID=A0A9D4WWG8_PEA|nr:hypothetical protein KIW84_055765 [Pisum sativum]
MESLAGSSGKPNTKDILEKEEDETKDKMSLRTLMVEKGESNEEKEPTRSKLRVIVIVIRGNCNLGNEMEIEFIAPKVVEGEIEIKIDNKDVELECLKMANIDNKIETPIMANELAIGPAAPASGPGAGANEVLRSWAEATVVAKMTMKKKVKNFIVVADDAIAKL